MVTDSSEISLIKFHTVNFFSIIINSRPLQPISTLLIKIVEALLSSENEPDEEIRERIDWIYKNTHEEVKKPLSDVELILAKNIDRGLNTELELGDNDFTIPQLYRYLDEVSRELTRIVIKIAKKYSLDIPIMQMTHDKNVIKIE